MTVNCPFLFVSECVTLKENVLPKKLHHFLVKTNMKKNNKLNMLALDEF